MADEVNPKAYPLADPGKIEKLRLYIYTYRYLSLVRVVIVLILWLEDTYIIRTWYVRILA